VGELINKLYCIVLHFAINDYITVTCGLLSFSYWGRYKLKEKCSSYLTTYQLAIFLEFQNLTEVTGLIVSRPLVNVGLAYVAFMSIKPYERTPLQRFKSITDVVKYSLTPIVRKAI